VTSTRGASHQPRVAPGGHFDKDRFDVHLDNDTFTCPAGHTAPICSGAGIAYFGDVRCLPLSHQCTNAICGRSIRVGRAEDSWPSPGPAS
jgi:hypothetical protein